ncbi:hypothetical protein [Modestobacter sp. VKM Ac-2978]|uniref:hypothetical protein n=1 Tax=Modestobacter sp. VKM Ac-2978 TaxID=3004132 RepID=UPI0022AAC6E9|nr:hypothetical protein [Modestobacter sp. VKM Ac-2978]MCZ2850305.1 hypothetical protein [Modestobacter sp. VKM Ac-2978]
MITTADRLDANLDRVATTLIGAVAAVGGLLAALGVNSERINLLFDDDSAQELLLAAGALAILAVLASLTALMVQVAALEVAALGAGAACYVGGLLCALFAAAGAADYAAHPAVTSLSLVPGETRTVLSFTVGAGSLDEAQSVVVLVMGARTDGQLYESVMRPDETGRVEQVLDVLLPPGTPEVTVMAWRGDQSVQPPSCGSGRANVVCASVVVP